MAGVSIICYCLFGESGLDDLSGLTKRGKGACQKAALGFVHKMVQDRLFYICLTKL